MTSTRADLRSAIEAELQGIRLRALLQASDALSARYRERASGAPPRPLSDLERLAYLVVRMPATCAAVGAALSQASRAIPSASVRTLLDLGSGVGAGLWSAADAWPELAAATLVDADGDMLSLGARVWRRHPRSSSIAVETRQARLEGGASLPAADAVVLSYVIGELEPAVARDLVRKAFDAARHAVIIVEPGTPAGYRSILEARTKLLEAGAHIVAPCPHDDGCPLTGDDWCHFAARLERSRVHRQLKQGELAWEDEKFSCVVAARDRGEPPPGRILRHPRIEKGRISLRLCTREGLADSAVTRRDVSAWRAARHARWGDEWPPPSREH